MSNDKLDEFEDAENCFNQGNFALARETFERILREASSSTDSLARMSKFNIATCLAAEGNLVEALDRMLDIEASGEGGFECTYNKALCLNELGRPDLALQMLSSTGATNNQTDESSYGNSMIELLINCLGDMCAQGPLSRKQAIMMDKVLLDYKPQIIAHIGEDLWNLNMGHVQFLIDCRFDESLQFYESLLNSENGEPHDNLLELNPDVLANICVSYILTGRNRDAEELIKEVEEAERTEQSLEIESRRMTGSLTHINLAISTLYCVKGNHEFGLGRLIKSLEPLDRKLNAQTWLRTSRCLLSTLDKHCKQMICIRDDLFDQIVNFLIQCEAHGTGIETRPIVADEIVNNSISCQARFLRSIVLTLIHD